MQVGTVCGTIMRMDDYSGKFNVRLPVGLHQALAERAGDEGVSLNQIVTSLLAGGLGFATEGQPLRLTKTEADVLTFTAQSARDDLDDMPLSEAEKRAYVRAVAKVRALA